MMYHALYAIAGFMASGSIGIQLSKAWDARDKMGLVAWGLMLGALIVAPWPK